jgi:hypothetical protein
VGRTASRLTNPSDACCPHVTSTHNSLNGIYSTNSNHITYVDCLCGNNSRLTNGSSGINITNGTAHTLIGCDTSGNGTDAPASSSAFGVLAGGASGVTIIGIYMEDNITDNIYLGAGMSGFNIIGGYCQDGQIFVDTADNGNILGVTFNPQTGGKSTGLAIGTVAPNIFVGPQNWLTGAGTTVKNLRVGRKHGVSHRWPDCRLPQDPYFHPRSGKQEVVGQRRHRDRSVRPAEAEFS